VLADTANIVLKYERDMQRAVEVLPRLLDPNRELLEVGHAHGHSDGHGHGGGHRDDHGPAGEHGPAQDETSGGQAVRAAKDRPGRHDEGYSDPGVGPSRRATSGQGQGSRSFAAFTRRRPG
jgi:hypothetical protein